MSDSSGAHDAAGAAVHPLAAHAHLPYFIPGADGSDPMMTNVLIALVIIVVIVGTLYLHLHSIPERLAHGKDGAHFELVAVLALVALFTHNNIFWVAALVLAFIRVPDFGTPIRSIAASLEALSGRTPVSQTTGGEAAVPEAAPQGEPAPQEPVPAAEAAAADAGRSPAVQTDEGKA